MRKKGLAVLIVRTMMNLYHGAKTKFGVESELSEKLFVKLGVYQGFV